MLFCLNGMSAWQRLLLFIYGDPMARPGWWIRTSGAGMLFCLGHRSLGQRAKIKLPLALDRSLWFLRRVFL